MTTDDADRRRAPFRTFNDWLGQVHWRNRFCEQPHPVLAARCVAPLGHATLGETVSLRQHTAFATDPVSRRAVRVTWRDWDGERWRLDNALGRHPASGQPPHTSNRRRREHD